MKCMKHVYLVSDKFHSIIKTPLYSYFVSFEHRIRFQLQCNPTRHNRGLGKDLLSNAFDCELMRNYVTYAMNLFRIEICNTEKCKNPLLLGDKKEFYSVGDDRISNNQTDDTTYLKFNPLAFIERSIDIKITLW